MTDRILTTNGVTEYRDAINDIGAAWKPLRARSVDAAVLSAGDAEYLIGQNTIAIVPGGSAPLGTFSFYLDPADLTIGGTGNVKLRVRLIVSTNAVAPGGDIAASLVSVATISGASGDAPAVATIGGVGTGTNVTSPGANNKGAVATGAEFTHPAAGQFALAIGSPAFAVPSGCKLGIAVELQYRQA